MRALIETKEEARGVLSRTKVYTLRCVIEYTPEEALILPDSGNPITQLTPDYSGGEFDFKGISFEKAASSGGQIIELPTIGQLKECEEMILAQLKLIQMHINSLKDYPVEKKNTFDIQEELERDAGS